MIPADFRRLEERIQNLERSNEPSRQHSEDGGIDYYAQVANGEIPTLDIDLANHSESPIAHSIAQIAQGVVGSFISEKGGLEKIISARMEVGIADNWKRGRENLIEDIKNDIKDDLRDFVIDLIAKTIEERVKPVTNLDVLRDRVNNFSLVEGS